MAAPRLVGMTRQRHSGPSLLQRRKRRFATKPPPGLYDPVLDQNLAAAGRGLKDLRQDTEQAGERASDDWTLARNRTNQQAGFSLTDINVGSGRQTQDYWRARQGLARNYSQLADQQRQSGNAAGLLGGGFQAQAARKRAENEALARGDLNVSNTRRMQDEVTARSRVGTARDQRLGDIDLSYQRGNEDRTRDLGRAQREYRNYGVDVGESRYYQARNLGWSPPPSAGGKGGKGGGRRRRRSPLAQLANIPYRHPGRAF